MIPTIQILVLLLIVIAAVAVAAARLKIPPAILLVITGVMLGAVLLVMVGEQVQEMQLAHWLPTTDLPALARRVPAWMGLWFSVFPNVQGLIAQAIALVLVLGSYFVAKQPKAATGKQAAPKRAAAVSKRDEMPGALRRHSGQEA